MAMRVACIILLVGGEGISVEVECITAKGKAPRIMAFAFCTTREDAACTIVTLGRGASMAIRMGREFLLEDGLVRVSLILGIDGMEGPRLCSFVNNRAPRSTALLCVHVRESLSHPPAMLKLGLRRDSDDSKRSTTRTTLRLEPRYVSGTETPSEPFPDQAELPQHFPDTSSIPLHTGSLLQQ